MMIVGGCHRTILDLCSYRASNVNLVGITFHNVLLSLNVIGSPSLSVIQAENRASPLFRIAAVCRAMSYH